MTVPVECVKPTGNYWYGIMHALRMLLCQVTRYQKELVGPSDYTRRMFIAIYKFSCFFHVTFLNPTRPTPAINVDLIFLLERDDVLSGYQEIPYIISWRLYIGKSGERTNPVLSVNRVNVIKDFNLCILFVWRWF